MSISLKILNQEDLCRRIEQTKAELERERASFDSIEKLKISFSAGDRAERDGWCNQSSFLRTSLDLARLLCVNGSDVQEIRAVLKTAVTAFAEIVPWFDYSPFESRFAVPKSQANKFEGHDMPHDLNQVFLAPSKSLGPNFTTVTVKVLRQPAQIETKEALLCALIAHDFEAAKTIAGAYRMRPAVKGSGPNHLGVLREAILGNTDAALAHLESIPYGYAADFPPARRELAEGVLRRDPRLIKDGLKASSTRFTTAWKLKTYCTPAKLKRYGSVESILPDIQRHLINHKWTLGDWAIAWMSLASHLGIKEAFEEHELFCEWIPWKLCCDDQEPDTKPRSSPKKTKSIGKRALKGAVFDAVDRDDGSGLASLLGQGADIESKNHNQHTPLLAAAAGGKAKCLSVLIESGADLNATDLQKKTGMALAAENGHAPIVAMLLEHGVSPDDGPFTATPMLYACIGGHIDVVKILIGAKADANRPDRRGVHTPITVACGLGNEPLVDLLLAAGADVNLPKQSRSAAILVASQSGNASIVKKLIDSGADLSVRDASDATCVHKAAEYANAAVISTLLSTGVSADSTDCSGRTPLHWAAVYWQVNSGYSQTIKVLLDGGANPNIQDSEGATPAMCAVNWPDRLAVLIEAGADILIKDAKGRTVLDHADDNEEAKNLINGALRR